jgi:hypothetical protein
LYRETLDEMERMDAETPRRVRRDGVFLPIARCYELTTVTLTRGELDGST